MKIGIVTIYDMVNYGNRLQNYAVYKSFAKEGLYAETLVCERKVPFIKKIKRKLLNELHAHRLPIYPISDLGYIRWCKFEKFTHKYIPTRIFYNDSLSLPKTSIMNMKNLWRGVIKYGIMNFQDVLGIMKYTAWIIF